MMKEEWVQEVENKPKLRTYRLFKTEFETEKYVFCKDRRKRSLFAQLRIGILPLRVETGRFSNIALAQRHCNMCSGSYVEDEKHFICNCNLYHDLRDTLFRSAELICPSFTQMNETQKLVFLFQKASRELSRFLSQAWQQRQNILYY